MAGLLLISPVLISLGGCRICADCEDLAYPAYGGAWQRTLRNSGRVGSVFDPGGAKAATLVDRSTPENPDEIERRRQPPAESDPDQDDPANDFDSPEQGDADEMNDREGDDDESGRNREEELRDKQLDDIESDEDDDIRKKKLEDIEVRIIPGGPPVMVKTKP